MSIRLRPRFALAVSLPPVEVMTRFRDLVESNDLPWVINLLDHQIEIGVRRQDQHFWSPFLNLLLEANAEQTVLQGKFGPNVNVWTLFVAAYSLLFLTGFMGMVITTSQLQIGQSPTGLFISTGCLVLAGLVWVAGQFGKKLAHDQMVDIHVFIHQVFADAKVREIYCEACGEDDPSRDALSAVRQSNREP